MIIWFCYIHQLLYDCMTFCDESAEQKSWKTGDSIYEHCELSLEEILCHHLKYFNILLKFINQLISKNIWELYFSLGCCSFLWNFYFIYFGVFWTNRYNGKCCIYIVEAHLNNNTNTNRGDWEFGFWSSLHFKMNDLSKHCLFKKKINLSQ